jgi:hypothetical protein
VVLARHCDHGSGDLIESMYGGRPIRPLIRAKEAGEKSAEPGEPRHYITLNCDGCYLKCRPGWIKGLIDPEADFAKQIAAVRCGDSPGEASGP